MKKKGEKIYLGEIMTIKKGQMFFDSVKFVSSGRMMDKTSPMINFIYYNAKKSRLWTTDGHRLHIAGEMGFGQNDCYFKVISDKKNEIQLEKMGENLPHLPNISLILQNVKTIYRHEIKFDSTGSIAYSMLMRLFKKAAIDFNFILDLKAASNTWTALIQEDENGQQFFKSGNFLAVIMPLNVD